MGFVKAGDWLSEIIPVRELCGRCALIYKWTENEQLVRYNIFNEIENT